MKKPECPFKRPVRVNEYPVSARETFPYLIQQVSDGMMVCEGMRAEEAEYIARAINAYGRKAKRRMR